MVNLCEETFVYLYDFVQNSKNSLILDLFVFLLLQLMKLKYCICHSDSLHTQFYNAKISNWLTLNPKNNNVC